MAVDLGDDVEGFVPVTSMGVTGLQNPADLFAEGDVLEMRITEVDVPNRRIGAEVTRIPKFEETGIPPLPERTEEPAAEADAEAAPAAEATEE